MLLASDPTTRRAIPSAAVWASSTRRPKASCADFACRLASRRFRLNRRSPRSRCCLRVLKARRRAFAPRRSALPRPVAARCCKRESSRLAFAGLRRGFSVSAAFSPPATAAPIAVSASRCACHPNDLRVLISARARVSAAFLADRLRRAAFRLRVATAFWAETFRSVCVWVAMGDHLLRSLATSNAHTRASAQETRKETHHAWIESAFDSVRKLIAPRVKRERVRGGSRRCLFVPICSR